MIKHSAKPLPKCSIGKIKGSSIEWAHENADPLALTGVEIERLQAKHKSININQVRALEVKRLMQQGKACSDIIKALRHRYGSRMIKGDHAALSEAKKAR